MHRPASSDKLYVLVRGDLSPGLQLAQAVHAATEYALRFPAMARSTENVVVLNVADEPELLSHAEPSGFLFHEPDVNDEATAYAIVADGRRFSTLPLAGRSPAMC
jgi:hypothetical protein